MRETWRRWSPARALWAHERRWCGRRGTWEERDEREHHGLASLVWRGKGRLTRREVNASETGGDMGDMGGGGDWETKLGFVWKDGGRRVSGLNPRQPWHQTHAGEGRTWVAKTAFGKLVVWNVPRANPAKPRGIEKSSVGARNAPSRHRLATLALEDRGDPGGTPALHSSDPGTGIGWPLWVNHIHA